MAAWFVTWWHGLLAGRKANGCVLYRIRRFSLKVGRLALGFSKFKKKRDGQMNKLNKPILCIVGVMCLFTALILFYGISRKQAVASLMGNARYVVEMSGEAVAQTNHIPDGVARELADKIKEDASIRMVGRKSVCYGRFFLLDNDMKQLAVVTILKYPLLQFDATQLDFQVQLEFRHDLVGALGLNKEDDYEAP